MLYFLSYLSDGGDLFNLFRYITFRAGGAFFTALIIFFTFGKYSINFLKKLQKDGQPIREDGPKEHIIKKAGTPTMGGVIILLAVIVSTILWARLDNHYVWIILFVTFSFGFIGLIDDYIKVVKRSYGGLSGRLRLLFGFLIAFIAVYFIQIQHFDDLNRSLALPIFKDHLVFLGVFFFPFAMLVIVGSANAVNLTDGLDGLAIMPVIIAGASLGIIAYIVGRADYSSYLDVHYIKGSGEILIFSAALIGSGLGFLWYNAPPAAVFMGVFFFPFAMIVIVGSANAVNLTDGLDGLAIMPVIIAGASLGIISYIVGRADYSSYLDVHYIKGSGEILIFSAALIGSGLGFLWYNAPPAAVFMGDTGSLSLGSALGCIAVSIKHELVLLIVGGLFVIETLSVIIQVLFFKITGKRVFLMAPIHHHFEKLGWSESQIVIRFWIIAVILAALGMATLKLR
jgi:phospho-N-acetylmuramoyl-pentapeptide-transferase